MAAARFAWCFAWTATDVAAITIRFTKRGCRRCDSPSRWKTTHHQHQTPRTEDGVEYGDFAKYLNAAFLGNVARDNAEALRQLALAPAPPVNARLDRRGHAGC